MTNSANPQPSSKPSTAQLNVRIDQLLADRLRERAKELHCNPGTLVSQAIEQLLDGSQSESAPKTGEDLLERIQNLEVRVAELEAKSETASQ